MNIKHLDKLVICHIDCSIWSGRKKLRPEDLSLPHPQSLPSSEVASLGSKKICDPEALNHFERLKKEAQRLCEQVGVRFLGGYAIPESQIKHISAELDRIRHAFTHHTHLFLANYNTVTQEWMAKHPNFAQAIQRAIAPIDEVQARFKFDYTVYRIQPTRQDKALVDKVSSLSDVLFDDIAKEANELYRSSMAGKEQLSQRALNPLKRMHSKLEGLVFLDARVEPVLALLTDVLGRLPQTGAISGGLFHELVSTVLVLSDPQKIQWQAHEARIEPTSSVPSNTERPSPEPVPLKPKALIHTPTNSLADKLRELSQSETQGGTSQETTHPASSSKSKPNVSSPTPPTQAIPPTPAKPNRKTTNRGASFYF